MTHLHKYLQALKTRSEALKRNATELRVEAHQKEALGWEIDAIMGHIEEAMKKDGPSEPAPRTPEDREVRSI